jgi:hypothetical protein
MSSVGFKFEEGGNNTPRTVQKVARVEPFIVSYIDNENKEQVRIVFRIPGAKSSYILQERISRDPVVLPAHDWFHKAFVDKLQAEGFEESPGEPVESV